VKQSPKNKPVSTLPLFVIDTLVPSGEKGKLTDLICRAEWGEGGKKRSSAVPKKLTLYPVNKTVTVHHHRLRENDRLELSIKGVAKKKIEPGMVLAPQNSRVETARKIWLLPCSSDSIKSVKGGDYHLYSSSFPLLGKKGKTKKRVDIVPLNRIVRINSQQPLFFQSGEKAAVVQSGETSKPLPMTWLTGGPLSSEQEQALDRAAASLSCTSPLVQFLAIICKIRGWVPAGGISPKKEKEGGMVLGEYWIDNNFFRRIIRFLETRAAVEGGITVEHAAAELSVPVKLLDEFVRYWQGKKNRGGFSIRKSYGHIVGIKTGEKAPLSPMTRNLLNDLERRGPAGADLREVRDERVAEQYNNLVRMGLAVMLSDQLICHHKVYHDLAKQAVENIRNSGPVPIAEFKKLWGVSRKYCIPLLEQMEQDDILARENENRFTEGG
jgi:hypothetical protein